MKLTKEGMKKRFAVAEGESEMVVGEAQAQRLPN